MAASSDLTCVKCRYALRGLDARGRCPECGERIRRSAAVVRLARLAKKRRPTLITAIAEAIVNAMAGLLLLGFVAEAVMVKAHGPLMMRIHTEPYIIAALISGVCLLLTWSSIRRTRGWLRVLPVICTVPAVSGTYQWVTDVMQWVRLAWFE